MADEAPRKEVARSELRASHEDRDRAVELLRVAAGDGRLTSEELDDRLERALTARTYGELTTLVADLPATGPGAVPATLAQPKDLVRIDCRSGNAKREGTWMVPQRMEVKVTSGNVTLDFTNAVMPQAMFRIEADVRSGNLTLITKPGVVVDADEVAVRSGNIKVRTPWGHDVPEILRVEVSGKVGSGNITARPPYRTFWQWLTRQPKPYELSSAAR
jgi:Domain of unknown function (DUF1707)